MNKPIQKSKSTAAAPNVTQKATAKPTTATPVKTAAIPAVEAPMHAAKGNDDIMSQPQASRIGKKKS